MLTSEGLREGQVWVGTPEEALDQLNRHFRERTERTMAHHGFDVVLGGLRSSGNITFPYPGPYGSTAPLVGLRRDQAEHLALELLKALNGGSMPDDTTGVLRLIGGLGR